MKKVYKYFLITALLCLCSNSAFADTNDYTPGTWANPDDLTMQQFTSADDFSFIATSNDDWNLICSNVNVDSCTYNSDDTDQGCYIKVFGTPCSGNTMAYQEHYKKVLWWYELTPATYTGTWGMAKIYLDTRSSSGLLDKTIPEQTKTFLHELGHCFGLSHPKDSQGNSESVYAIMHQGYSGYAKLSIQEHDEDNLNAKY